MLHAGRLSMPSRVPQLRCATKLFGTISVFGLASISFVSVAHADMFAVSYLSAGTDTANLGSAGPGALCAGEGTCVLGVQTFDSSIAGNNSFFTSFGTNGQITGTYSSGF